MSFETSNWPQPQPQDDVTRALPHALGPEKSLLSTMLQDPLEFIGVAIEEKLTEAHFYLPSHSTLYGFLCELFAAGDEIELVSIVQKLLDRGLLDRCGGPAGLTDLYTYAPSPGHFRHHLQFVKDKFVARSIISAGNAMIAGTYDSPDEPYQVLDDAENRLMSIREGSSTEKPVTSRELIDSVLTELQQRCEGGEQAKQGIATGFEDLDRMTGGLRPGNMIVVAARPSMGKTSLMMNIVEHVCVTDGRPTMVFSCEMPAKDLMQRLIFARAKFHDETSRGVKPDKGDLQRIQRAAIEINKAKLFIDDQPAITINELRAKARRKMRESGLALIAIDYLQLMRSKSKQADGSREREVAEISAGIKSLAKELGIPIIILAQINRDAEKRTGKSLGVPRMSDLRESGAIEQDADIVGLLYRSAYYAQDDAAKEAEAGRAQLIIAKNRNGETGNIHLTFIAELMRFETGRPYQEELPQQAKPFGKRYED